jgi:hypothetical protein
MICWSPAGSVRTSDRYRYPMRVNKGRGRCVAAYALLLDIGDGGGDDDRHCLVISS